MQTVTITIYTFDELSEDAKKHALEAMRDINTEVGDWWHFVYEDWKTKLEENGFFAVTIFFRGFWSQGDGACFEAKVDVEKWLKAHKLANKHRAIYNNTQDISITITDKGQYYHHEMTMSVNCEYFGEHAKVYDTVDQLATEILEDARDSARAIYKDLERAYEYLISDEAISETIRANEYQFLANGSRKYFV